MIALRLPAREISAVVFDEKGELQKIENLELRMVLWIVGDQRNMCIPFLNS